MSSRERSGVGGNLLVRVEENPAQTDAILEAIAAGDPVRARRAMSAHVHSSGELVADWFERPPSGRRKRAEAVSSVREDSATLPRLLDGGAGAALIRAEDGAQTPYDALAETIDEIAGNLHSLGVKRGDRVALVHPDGQALIPLLLGVTALGAAAAPLNPAYTCEEFAFFLDDLAPAAVIVPEGDLEAARQAAGSSIRVFDARGAQLLDGRRESYESARPDDVALLLHTSGTTSRPKQVPLRHRNLVASARSIAAFYELTEADVSYGAMPMFHVHGLVASTLATWASGGSVVVPSRFLPRRFWEQLGAVPGDVVLRWANPPHDGPRAARDRTCAGIASICSVV